MEKYVQNASLVSVIVPIYKIPEKYLRRCIESIVNQSYQPIEIILVDDGSPDRCGEICNDYAAQNSHVTVIHQDNQGLSAARNAGFKRAQGEWICFVDGDDWIDSRMIEKMRDAAQGVSVELIFCDVVKDYARSTKLLAADLPEGYCDAAECKKLPAKLLCYSSNLSSVCAKLYRRSFLMEAGLVHDEKNSQGAEGIEFNSRVFGAVSGAYCLHEPLYHYTYNNQSISAKPTEENNLLILRCFDRIRANLQVMGCWNSLHKQYYQRMAYVVVATAINGYFNPSIKMDFRQRLEGCDHFLSLPLIVETLHNASTDGIDKLRRIIYHLIKKRWYSFVFLLACMKNLKTDFMEMVSSKTANTVIE